MVGQSLIRINAGLYLKRGRGVKKRLRGGRGRNFSCGRHLENVAHLRIQRVIAFGSVTSHRTSHQRRTLSSHTAGSDRQPVANLSATATWSRTKTIFWVYLNTTWKQGWLHEKHPEHSPSSFPNCTFGIRPLSYRFFQTFRGCLVSNVHLSYPPQPGGCQLSREIPRVL